MEQIHSKFKVFITKTDSNGNISAEVHEKINTFIAANKVAVKSVGVEYLEQEDYIVISLGYTEGQEHYSVVLQEVNLGSLALDESVIASALTKACDGMENVICHEFYVKGNNYTALFLKMGEKL